jgi:hypothetical protein
MKLLMPATLRPREDNSDLSELYDKLLDQWAIEMEHVVNVVGGSYSREKYGSQLGPRFIPVPPAQQRAAVKFLAENAFRTPRYLLDSSLIRRIEPDGALRRIGYVQSRVLLGLFDNDRLDRLSDYEALAGKRSAVYPLSEMLADVRRAVWTELSSSSVSIDPFRRSLQRTWLGQADAKLNPTPAIIITPPSSRAQRARSSGEPNTDVRALMRGELLALKASIDSAIGRSANHVTRLHLLDAREEIRRILDPER